MFQTACHECWIRKIIRDFHEKGMLSACMQRVVECSNFRRFRRKSKPMYNAIYFNYQLKYTCLHFRIIFSEISAKICNSHKNIFSIMLYRELKKVNVNVNVNFNASAKICNSNKNIFSILLHRELKKVNVNVNYHECNFWEISAKK